MSFFGRILKRLKRSFADFFKMPLWDSRLISLSFLSAFLLMLAVLIFVAVKLPNRQILLTLHYTAGLGIDYIGNNIEFYHIPGLAALIVIFNFGYAVWVYKKNRLFAQITSLIALLTVIITGAAIMIIFWVSGVF